MTWNAISNLQAIFSTSEQMVTVTNTLLHRNVTKEWYKVILPSSSALKIQKILTYEHKKEHLFKETRFQDDNLYEVKCRMLHHLKGTSLVIYSFLQMMYQHFFHFLGKQYISLHRRHSVAPSISDQCLEARRKCLKHLPVSFSFLFALISFLQKGSNWVLWKSLSEAIQLDPNCQDTVSTTQSILWGSQRYSVFKQAMEGCSSSNLYPRLLPACYLMWTCAYMTYSHRIT